MDTNKADSQVKVPDAAELFEALRRYAQQHHVSMLELIAEYALDDLPTTIGRAIQDKVEESKPKVNAGEVKYWATFDSGRSDISEHMEDIIYGSDADSSAI